VVVGKGEEGERTRGEETLEGGEGSRSWRGRVRVVSHDRDDGVGVVGVSVGFDACEFSDGRTKTVGSDLSEKGGERSARRVRFCRC